MKKKVLHITYSLQTGGLERLVINLANAMDDGPYEPYICCIATPGELAKDLSKPSNLLVIGHKGRINLAGWKSVYRIIKEYRFDIVHSHNMAGLLYGVPAAKLANTPIIHTNHGYVAEERNNVRLVFVESILSRLVDRYVCVSCQLLQDVEKRLHIRSDRARVIYNGVKLPMQLPHSVRSNGQQIAIGSVGSLIHIKNYRFLIEAFSAIVKRWPMCRLELIGDGYERAELEKLRDELDLHEKVIFRGKVSIPEDYVSALDVFVMVSLSEGLSLSILEAMSLNKLCVVSDVGGNSEIIIDGKNGFMFQSNDKQSFNSVMDHVLNTLCTDDMERIREAAGRTVRDRFSLDITVEKYRDCYEAMTC